MNVEDVLEQSCRERLRSASANLGVVLSVGPQSLTDVAFRWLANTPGDSEVVFAAPAVKGWRAADFATHIVERVSGRPRARRWLVLISEVDQMSRPLHDRLLRLLEEPSAPTTFVIGVSNPSMLPAALMSRVSAEVPLSPTEPSDLMGYLLAAGVSEAVASNLVSIDISLVGAALDCVSVAPLLMELVSTSLWSQTPVGTVDRLLARIPGVAAKLSEHGWGREEVEARLVEEVLNSWERQVLACVLEVPAAELLSVVDRARESVARYRPARSALVLATVSASALVPFDKCR